MTEPLGNRYGGLTKCELLGISDCIFLSQLISIKCYEINIQPLRGVLKGDREQTKNM